VLETPSEKPTVTSFNALSSDSVSDVEVPLYTKPRVTSYTLPFVVPKVPKVPSWIAAPTAFKPLFSNSVPYLKNGGPKQLSSEPGTSSYKPWSFNSVLNPISEVPEKFSTEPAQTSFKSPIRKPKKRKVFPTFESYLSRLQNQRKKVPRERSNEAANTSYNDAIEVSDLSDMSFPDEESSNALFSEFLHVPEYLAFERPSKLFLILTIV
jgi:hypothetical protein